MTKPAKMTIKIFGLTAAVLLTGVCNPLWAEESTSAMAAPKCDMEKMQKLCKENAECVKVEKGAWEGGYNVTSKDKAAETKFMTDVVMKNCM